MEKVKIKFNYKFILKYLAIFFVCLVIANAKVAGLSPFLFAFYFACLFVGFDEKILAVFTLCSGVVTDISLENFFVTLTVVAVGLAFYYIHRLAKKRMHLITLFIAYLVSLVTHIYYNYIQFQNLIYYILLGLISLYVFIVVMQVMCLRKNCFKLTLDESICFLFMVALLGVGLAPINIFNFSLCRLVLMMFIFMFISIGSPTLTMSLTLAFTLGISLSEYSLLPMAEFALVAMMGSVFAQPHKFKILLMTIIADVFVRLYFFDKGIDLLYTLLPIVVAGLVYILIPNKWLNSLADLVYVKKSEMSSRNLINTTRKSIRKRMSELSNVFLDMKQLHLNMVKRELNKQELIAMLTREVMNSCCKDCLDKNRCTRSLGTDNKSNLELLVEIAVTKGRVTLLDIPASLSNRCGKMNNLITLINRLSDEYRQYKNMMADINNVKVLLADQMGAVSKLLLNLGEEIDTNVTFDIARENKIISRLLSQNIECKEVLLYTEKNNELSAVIVAKSIPSNNLIIEKVLTETLKSPMRISSIRPVDDTDYNTVTLHTRSKYDCVFGLASTNKSGNEECGDCHSIIRLGADRFLLALCDGMGSGKSAHKMSAMTLGLIEDFYKVGFDNEIVLESVNKLLAINNQESYSTLDVCLLDLNHEIADFIKVGAPYGLIKREGNIELIEGGALPIGALDAIRPAVYKTTISTKDIVILATDGITDAFVTQENLIEYVSKLATNNPQTLAESILAEALHLNGMSAKDDMTVLVARTYLKN